jgi:DNA-binding response OmpR family regulator
LAADDRRSRPAATPPSPAEREADLRATAEREAVDRMKTEFISMVSHELRTPLTSIRGAMGLLEAGVVGALPPPALELVRIARTNADRLIRLVNDILDLEKLEAGRVELVLAALDPAELVAGALDAQVLINLLGNAIKFSPDGGEVTLRVAPAGPGDLRVSVEDHGPGIPAGQMDRLFTRFGQLDASDRRGQGGTGLGLAISRSIVEQHGGRIGVVSEPGTRTEFWFELARAYPELAASPAESAPAHPSVLFVEGDADFAEVLTIRLAHAGYAVEHVATAAEARSALARSGHDVVLLDLGPADDEGAALLAAMREGALPQRPIVVVSAREAGGEPEPPVVDRLQKPFDDRHLLAALRRALRTPGPPRVLLVDPDTAVRTVIAVRLRAAGIECLEAGDRPTTIRLAGESDPDAIVLEPLLPDGDGAELVAQLRRGRTRTASLVVYTSADLDADGRAAITLGPTLHLTKARASEEQLADAVRDAVAGLP